MTIDEILAAYPHICPADIDDALAYAYDHADEIAALSLPVLDG